MNLRKHIPVIWLWMAALLLSTVGFSVQQIYCYCLGETTFSLFVGAEDSCMDTAVDGSGFCKKMEQADCCSKKVSDTTPPPCCSKKSVSYFHLEVEFTVEKYGFKNLNCPIWAEELPDFYRLYRPVICDAAQANENSLTKPPPRSGRLICLQHELFRC